MLMKPARRAAWEGPGYPRGRGPEAATDPGSTPLLLMGWGGAGMLVAGSRFFLLDAERIVLMPTRPRTSLTDQGEPTPTSAPRQLPSCVPWARVGSRAARGPSPGWSTRPPPSGSLLPACWDPAGWWWVACGIPSKSQSSGSLCLSWGGQANTRGGWGGKPYAGAAVSTCNLVRKKKSSKMYIQLPGPHLRGADRSPEGGLVQEGLPPRALGSSCPCWLMGTGSPWKTLPQLPV